MMTKEEIAKLKENLHVRKPIGSVRRVEALSLLLDQRVRALIRVQPRWGYLAQNRRFG